MSLNIKKIIFFSSIISILAYEDLAAMEKNYPVNYVPISSDAELRTFCHILDKMYCYPSFEMKNKNLALTQDFYEKVFAHIYNVNAKIAKDNGHLIIFNYYHVPEVTRYFEATKAYFEPIARKKEETYFLHENRHVLRIRQQRVEIDKLKRGHSSGVKIQHNPYLDTE